MKIQTLVFCGILAASLTFVGCNGDDPEQDCTTSADQAIELVYPVGGETFALGDKVPIQWKVNADRVGAVVPYVSIDEGRSWNTIPTGGAVFNDEGGATFQCQSLEWIIGSEAEQPNYATAAANGQVSAMIELRPYQAQEDFADSEPFTITVQ